MSRVTVRGAHRRLSSSSRVAHSEQRWFTSACLARPRCRPALPPGRRAVVLRLDADHRRSAGARRSRDRDRGAVGRAAASRRRHHRSDRRAATAPVAFGPPLAGGPWIAVYDPLPTGGHRTTLIAPDGVARIPARFAVDWILAPAQTAPAPPNAAPAYNGFGREVLAVADGVVVRSRDGAPDQPPRRVADAAAAATRRRQWQLRRARHRRRPLRRLRTPPAGQRARHGRRSRAARRGHRRAGQFRQHVDWATPALSRRRRRLDAGG